MFCLHHNLITTMFRRFGSLCLWKGSRMQHRRRYTVLTLSAESQSMPVERQRLRITFQQGKIFTDIMFMSASQQSYSH